MATIDRKWLNIFYDKNYISVRFTPVADIGDKKFDKNNHQNLFEDVSHSIYIKPFVRLFSLDGNSFYSLKLAKIS